MALSRPNTNYVDGSGYTWTITDNPALNADDVALILSGGGGGGGGSAWYTGAGAPTTLHNDGDFYLDSVTGEVWQQVSGVWVDQGFSIKGPAGPTGPAGSTGTAGTSFLTGSGAPSSGSGANGDTYLDYTSGTLYHKASGTWTAIGSAYPKASILGSWQGTMPATLGTGVEVRVPKLRGSSVTWQLAEAWARVTIPDAGLAPIFRIEKSAGGGAFSASTVSTLTIAAGSYETTDSGVATTVTSGDLLRITFLALGSSATAYTVQLAGTQT